MAASIKKLNCDSFEVRIEFDEERFKKKEFIRDVKPDDKDNNEFFHYHFGSRNKRIKDFAVLDLFLDGKNSSLRLYFTHGESDFEDVREPYLENVTQWLSSFFDTKSLQASLVAFYRYKKDFEPVISLNFPLLVKNDLYNGVNVSGLILEFPTKSGVKNIYLTSVGKETVVAMLAAETSIDFSNFNFLAEIERFSIFTSNLFRNKVKENVKSSQKKRTSD